MSLWHVTVPPPAIDTAATVSHQARCALRSFRRFGLQTDGFGGFGLLLDCCWCFGDVLHVYRDPVACH